MFEARIEEGHIFRKIVDAIKELVKSVNLEANGTGVSIQAMDTSHVALVVLQLNEKGFKRYRCDRALNLGLNIENLQKILKCSGNGDSITLRTEEEEPTTLNFTFETKKGDRVSEFKLQLMQIDSEQLGVPETDYTSVVRMPSQEFSKICKELANINEAIGIETSKESIKFQVKGDIGEGQIVIKANNNEKEEDRVVCDVEEPVNLTFSVRYLNHINKAITLSNVVILSMSQDQPLVVEYPIQDMGSLKMYLAPKINDDEQQA